MTSVPKHESELRLNVRNPSEDGIFMGVLGVAFQEKHVMTAIEIEQLSKRFTELILTYS